MVTPALFQQSVKGYYRLIYGVDRVIGRILTELERRGLDKNTIVVLTSDHGFYLGERGLSGKWFMHEESIRTPLVVYGPPELGIRRGLRLDAMTLNIDIAPTLLAWAEIEAPESMQGKSLVPLIGGKSMDWRTDFFYEHLFEHPHIPKSEGVRGERWKYTLYLDAEPVHEELFDLAADPMETVNLATSNDAAAAHQLGRMRSRLAYFREILK